MTVEIVTDQFIYNDPYSQRIFDFDTAESDVAIARIGNLLSNLLGNDIVLDGCEVSVAGFTTTDITIEVAPGWVIMDNTVIRLESATQVTFPNANVLNPAGQFVVSLNYQYLQTIVSNPIRVKVNYLDPTTKYLWPESSDPIKNLSLLSSKVNFLIINSASLRP